MKTIIDVSENNGVINWAQVRGHVDGVIVRAGYRGWGGGTIVRDARALENLSYAAHNQIPVGVYFVTQAVTEAESIEEAQYCSDIASLAGVSLTLPVCYDDEDAGGANGRGRRDKLPRAARTATAIAFCRQVERMGYTSMLYCSASWFRDKVDGEAVRRAGALVWLASVENVRPSVAWDGWQYSWKGRVPGINSDVDMSRFEEGNDMTKEQVLQIIAEYEVEKAKKPVSGYAKQAWQDAKKAGVLDGTSPQGGLTREQLAAVLSRLGLIK